MCGICLNSSPACSIPGALPVVVAVAAHEVRLPLGEGDRVDILELVDGLRHGAPGAAVHRVQPHPVDHLGVGPVHCQVPPLGVLSSHDERSTVLYKDCS